MVLLGLRAPDERMGISLYFGTGRASIMSISFCVGVWWLWGRGGGKGQRGKLICRNFFLGVRGAAGPLPGRGAN